MMAKNDNEGLQNSKLYNGQPDLFEYYLELVIRFAQDFDPTETLMAIAKDGDRIEVVAPDWARSGGTFWVAVDASGEWAPVER